LWWDHGRFHLTRAPHARTNTHAIVVATALNAHFSIDIILRVCVVVYCAGRGGSEHVRRFVEQVTFEALAIVLKQVPVDELVCATHCNTPQYTAAHCHTLEHAATCRSTLQHTAMHCSTLSLEHVPLLRCVAVCCSVCGSLLRCAAVCCILKNVPVTYTYMYICVCVCTCVCRSSACKCVRVRTYVFVCACV